MRPAHHSHRRHGHDSLGRGGRFFDQGELRPIILALIGEQPRHGYDLIRAIEERTAGAYAPSPGVIYPTLQVLEDMGHIALAPKDEGKKTYAITDEGRAWLEQNGTQIGDMLSRMRHRGSRHAARSPRIAEAMESLKSALRSSLETLSEADLDRAAAAIEQAAAHIRGLRDAVTVSL